MGIEDRHNKFIQAAYAVALASPGVGGKKHKTFRLGAVITDKKRVLVARFNCYKSHPKLLKFFPWPVLHAEASAILSLGMDNCYGKSLYVARVHRNGDIALAKPCPCCSELIQYVGIKEIYYTTSRGFERVV